MKNYFKNWIIIVEPPYLVPIYYLLISTTFGYLYYHKFLMNDDFYNPQTYANIYSVIDLTASKAIQYRLIIPFLYKALLVITPLPGKTIFFIMVIAQVYITLIIFYILLNEYFTDKKLNILISPVIIYPMVWNFIILNMYYIFCDFAGLIIILLGYLTIIKKKHIWLLVVFLTGSLNHDSTGFLILMYLFFNYKRLFKKETIFYTIMMAVIFLTVKTTLYFLFKSNIDDPFWFRFYRNIEMIITIGKYYILRDILFIYGGLHVFVIFNIKKIWRQYPSEKLIISLTIIPYLIVLFTIHTFEDMRDYIPSIPYILIPFLIYLSTFKNSVLKPKIE